MKRNMIFLPVLIVLVFSAPQARTQGSLNPGIPLLGDDAPSFTAQATTGTINFPKDFGDDWKVIFSHPADFTPVCSSEILELAALQDNLKKMNVDIIVVSTDSLETHKKWVKSIDSVTYRDRELPNIKFPLVADEDHSIARKYGMIHRKSSTTRYVRGVFIIDPMNKVRAMFFYPMNVGRNMDEITRTIVALQTSDKDHILTPANWHAGEEVLVPIPNKKADQQALAIEEPDLHMLTWYMWFRKSK
jgi:peroxiredoxin (alkyl hydroperoxide reductase subunit C)